MSELPIIDEVESTLHRPELVKLDSCLSCRNVSVFYGDLEAIKSVDLQIPSQMVTAFIGPSGCGKSTLLRTFNRMNDTIPSARIEGEILLNDTDIYARDMDVPELRRRVGMVFQEPNPFPMSIFENVAFGLRIKNETNATTDEVVEDALRRAALWDEVKDRLESSAMSLSGGQQQRLCIARALAVGPQVLLMDEPTSALDPVATEKIEELIVELREDFTVVIVTHNMQQAERISDMTAFFYMGDLVEFGRTTQVFNEPREAKTRAYVQGDFG